MHQQALEILQCPYCGSSFTLDAGPTLRQTGAEITTGLLRCQCTTYPIVDGIPVLLASYCGDGSFPQLLADAPEQVLYAMLGLDDERQAGFEQWLSKPDGTYSELLELFCPGVEGPYFVHRFANPTFLVGQSLLRAVASDPRCFAKRAIDLGGGSGHLVRVLSELAQGQEVWLAETNYWKLWLARRIVAPNCLPICADAEAPLPFRRDSFSLALCSDAFHYIWSKRMFASEMLRMVGADGVIVVNHVHNALQENHSLGLPLAPRWWRNLFAELGARAFKESAALNALIERQPLDLSPQFTDEELAGEQALFMVATLLDGFWRSYDYPGAQFTSGVWRLNPLYEVEAQGEELKLRLNRFPSPSYEDEYKDCKRYLPAELVIPANVLERAAAGAWDDELQTLAESYVLLNVPEHYL